MKYSKALVKKICEEFTSGNNSIEDVCKKCGITKDEYYRWKETKPYFFDSIKAVEKKRLDQFKEMALSGLATLLVKHDITETKTEFEKDKEGNPTPVKTIKTNKTIMPNAAAVIYTLNNRDSDNWKHKEHVDHTSNGKGFLDFLMDDSADDQIED